MKKKKKKIEEEEGIKEGGRRQAIEDMYDMSTTQKTTSLNVGIDLAGSGGKGTCG